jgi:hypothetical protein
MDKTYKNRNKPGFYWRTQRGTDAASVGDIYKFARSISVRANPSTMHLINHEMDKDPG